MTRTKRTTLAIAAGLLTLLALGSLAIADDGGVMQRLMGHDAYAQMVNQMRTVLGNERTDQMLTACDQMMAAAPAGNGMMNGPDGSGMGAMMSGAGMGAMMSGSTR